MNYPDQGEKNPDKKNPDKKNPDKTVIAIIQKYENYVDTVKSNV
jgi:hypothetical protein